MVTPTIPIEKTRADSSFPGGRMITLAESLSEAMGVRNGLLRPKCNIKIATWDVRPMWEPWRTAQVLKEMEKYHFDILGVSECRWSGSGRTVNDDRSVTIYSGHDSAHTLGVALILSKEQVSTLMKWQLISPRLFRTRFHSKYCSLTILQCYAPKKWNRSRSERWLVRATPVCFCPGSTTQPAPHNLWLQC